jgi:AMMECR1 domain-containing protein
MMMKKSVWDRRRLLCGGDILRVFFLPRWQRRRLEFGDVFGDLCSQKAGLPSDCFKEPGTKIYTPAEIFFKKNPRVDNHDVQE